jgi:cobalt/nickel transport system permease protein
MHMANELLSPAVAVGTCVTAAIGIGLICRKLNAQITPEKIALMGVMGAFVFAGQMINFPLPVGGASGHLTGAVLLAIILGPAAAAIVMASVVFVQCLIFQDGGILALGCNTINMSLVPVFVGWGVYQLLIRKSDTRLTKQLACITACVISTVIISLLPPIQAAISGVLVIPVKTFMTAMVSVHLFIGIGEGLITAAVLSYIAQVRPEILNARTENAAKLTAPAFYATLMIITVITAGALSLVASEKPDGLEWSYAASADKTPVI